MRICAPTPAGVLRELGYQVLEAATGRQALELLQRPLQVALTCCSPTWSCPTAWTAAQLADEAAATAAGMKVLFTTGYTRNAIVHNGRLDAGVELLGKPFSFSDLANKVRSMLDVE